MDTLTIDQRFCGPPRSGNGGYSAGALAGFLEGSVTVRLIQPPPLETPLTVHRDADGVTLKDGDNDVARAVPAALDLTVPSAPTATEVARCTARFRGHEQHAFPTCFVCGPARRPGDGLRIFAGPTDDDAELVAAPWTPDASLAGSDDRVEPVFAWAALDCAGAYAFTPRDGQAVVLGEMTARLDSDLHVDEPVTVLGWHLASDGRKHDTGTALVRADGSIAGRARARWFEIPADRLSEAAG